MDQRRSPLHRTLGFRAPTRRRRERGRQPGSALRSAAFCLLAAGMLTGCVYRLDIQQGNLLEMDTVEQVQVGMTRSQVQFLLGTPTVADTFHDNRWDYPYYYRAGRQRDIEQRWFVVFFEEDRVTSVAHRIAPEGESAASPAS